VSQWLIGDRVTALLPALGYARACEIAAKARETVYIGIVGISDKFGAGAAEQAIDFKLYVFNRSPVLGFARSFMHTVASIGYFLRKPAVVYNLVLYLVNIMLFGLSFFVSFPNELIYGMIGLFLSQAIGLPGYLQAVLEKTTWKGTVKFLRLLPLLALTYISALFSAFQVGVKKGYVNSGDYVATGRRAGRQAMLMFMDTHGMKDPDLFNRGNGPRP